MKSKKNIVLIILIIILFAFLSVITYFKFFNKSQNIEKYNIIEIGSEKRVSNIDYVSLYSDKKIGTNYDFNEVLNVFKNDIVMNLKIKFENSILYLEDEYGNKAEYDITEKIKDVLVAKWDDYVKEIYVLTENKNMYAIELVTNFVTDIKFNKINKNVKIESFTNIPFFKYKNRFDSEILAFSDDNKLYFMPYEVLYETNMFIVDQEFIVYEDRSASTIDGRVLKNSDGKKYIVNYIFEIIGENPFKNKPEKIIATGDNHIIYLSDDKIYEYKTKFKIINYSGKYEEQNNLVIEFENGEKFTLTASFDKDVLGF